MYRRRRQLTPEEKKANEEARWKRNRDVLHCQICSRDILANTGVIAHHGYERPAYMQGTQTSSCSGARELPYEVSRERLGQHIVGLKDLMVHLKEGLASIIAEKGELSVEHSERDPNNRWEKIRKLFWFTRDTFEKIRSENEAIFIRHGWRDFDMIKTMHVRSTEFQIENLANDIAHQEGRFARWKQTHEWDGATWKKLEQAKEDL